MAKMQNVGGKKLKLADPGYAKRFLRSQFELVGLSRKPTCIDLAHFIDYVLTGEAPGTYQQLFDEAIKEHGVDADGVNMSVVPTLKAKPGKKKA